MESREDYKHKIEYIVEHIAKICCANNIDWRTKRNMLNYVPDLKDIPLERNYSETITIHQDKLCRMKMGVGYKHEGSLARREYSMLNGIEYNRSEWQIYNKTQLS